MAPGDWLLLPVALNRLDAPNGTGPWLTDAQAARIGEPWVRALHKL
jgi:hypothetical protein